MRVKLCGLPDLRALRLAAEARPDAIGLVFAPSVRQVRPEDAAALLAIVPEGVERWAVFRTPDLATLRAIAHLPLTGVQADATWDGAGLPTGWAFLPVFPDGPDLLDRVRAAGFDGAPRVASSLAHAFLVDGPTGGGRGQPADWARAAQAAQLGPLVLAGGLTPDNVAAAVAAVRPWAVDVSSGTESAPGVKDGARLRAFAAAARGA
jgi:phosphoribosylanthranilate isomerase